MLDTLKSYIKPTVLVLCGLLLGFGFKTTFDYLGNFQSKLDATVTAVNNQAAEIGKLQKRITALEPQQPKP